ncbi:hypothetical protein A11A3_16145 [Alcanivorax hongdengensis A-11-3]|uniref:Uncharacterized protein n=2 Tax=Alcanivorax hongdengensis TaxID=519051 RepID=L0W8A6_9GAMM|nr:hypothetical protein A11A3_16145 [Alcanivorax hongdengensis A-11-3]
MIAIFKKPLCIFWGFYKTLYMAPYEVFRRNEQHQGLDLGGTSALCLVTLSSFYIAGFVMFILRYIRLVDCVTFNKYQIVASLWALFAMNYFVFKCFAKEDEIINYYLVRGNRKLKADFWRSIIVLVATPLLWMGVAIAL